MEYNIDKTIAKKVYFIRKKPIKTDSKNFYDDSQYRLSFRFDSYENIDYFPLYYKITINNFPNNDSLSRFEEVLRNYDPFSYIWVPGYQIDLKNVFINKQITAEFTINLDNRTSKQYMLKFRSFKIAYNDEPVGEVIK